MQLLKLRGLAGLSGSGRGDSQGKQVKENAAKQPERCRVHDSASGRGRHSADDRPQCPLTLKIVITHQKILYTI